jgi:competence protein ComEA
VPERSKWTAIAWAAVAAAIAFAAIRGLGGGAGDTPPPVRVEESGGGPAHKHEEAGLYVHVAGAVRRPGLYRIPEGSRVAVALARAGGPTRAAEVAAVNLAAPVEDGQQVVVPQRGPGGAAGTAAGGAGVAAAPGAKVSLAAATAEQLDELDGIGPTLAERIIEFRDEHGGFRSVDQLREVEGIGEKRFEALKEALRP